MLISPDLVEHSIYFVKYNLGSCCLIISISVFVLGAMKSEHVDEAWEYGTMDEMAILQTLLHALIIWICSVACKTTSRLAFHSLYTFFPVDLQDIDESPLHLT